MVNTVKVPASVWIDTAREALILEGLPGLKINRLAKRLGVTRGGFYHHFRNQQELCDAVISDWSNDNELIPDWLTAESPKDAANMFTRLHTHMILEASFSPEYELAVREWARTDSSVHEVVDQKDAERIDRLRRLFLALGCEPNEAEFRAKVYYFHQIGYYSLGYHRHNSKESRLTEATTYMKILCGRRLLEAADHPDFWT